MSSASKLIVVLLVAIFVAMVVGVVLLVGLYAVDPGASGASASSSAPAAKKPEVVAGVTPLPAVAPDGAAVERVRARGELVVAMDTGTPPWVGSPPTYFLNARGEPDGFDYVVAKRIADRVGVPKVKLVHGAYDELPEILRADTGIDLFIAGYAPDGSEGIAFSESYLEYGLCLVVPAKSKVSTTADLWGKRIAIYPDDAAEADVRRLVKGYTDLQRVADGYWDLLLTGKIDAFLYDLPYAVAEIEVYYKQNPQHRGKLRIAQYNLTDSFYAVGLRAADTDLLALTNQTIADFRASPDYARAIKQYLAGAPTVDTAEVAGRTHTVAAGETLSTIAAASLGSADRWKDIWELNKSRMGNPNLVEVGDVILLP